MFSRRGFCVAPVRAGDVVRDTEKAEYDEMMYERRAALLELECVNARRNVFDVEEVLEENRALRQQVAALAAERHLSEATEAGMGSRREGGVNTRTSILFIM